MSENENLDPTVSDDDVEAHGIAEDLAVAGDDVLTTCGTCNASQ
jgi:hypothetical protein